MAGWYTVQCKKRCHVILAVKLKHATLNCRKVLQPIAPTANGVQGNNEGKRHLARASAEGVEAEGELALLGTARHPSGVSQSWKVLSLPCA